MTGARADAIVLEAAMGTSASGSLGGSPSVIPAVSSPKSGWTRRIDGEDDASVREGLADAAVALTASSSGVLFCFQEGVRPP